MQVKVLFLGAARDLAGAEIAAFELTRRDTLGTLRDAIGARFPRLGPGLATMRTAVNYSFVGNMTELHEGDEVALIPPVSGG